MNSTEVDDQAGKNSDKTAFQSELLYNRLVKRWKHLRKWARRIGVDAYRLYGRDIPEIPLVLELYGEAVSGALYKRPYEKDEAEEALWLDAMTEAVSRALNIPAERIFIKTRQKQRGEGAQYSRFGDKHFECDVNEGNLKFRVNLSDYLDTGLFLDARKKRSLLLTEAKGKRVLNLFSYTCSLSVAAAAGSALSVDSVDMSNTYLEWGEINFSLNGYKTSLIDGRNYFKMSSEQLAVSSEKISSARCSLFTEPYKLIRADVLAFLDQANRARKKWDLIILDPPSFSNSKKMTSDLDIRRDYKELIGKCLSLLSPGGKIWFSTNRKGFMLGTDDFPGYAIRDMGNELVDEDFRGKRMPMWYVITLLSGVIY